MEKTKRVNHDPIKHATIKQMLIAGKSSKEITSAVGLGRTTISRLRNKHFPTEPKPEKVKVVSSSDLFEWD